MSNARQQSFLDHDFSVNAKKWLGHVGPPQMFLAVVSGLVAFRGVGLIADPVKIIEEAAVFADLVEKHSPVGSLARERREKPTVCLPTIDGKKPWVKKCE